MADVPTHESLARARRRASLPAVTSPRNSEQTPDEAARNESELLCLRFDVAEAARILKFSRATLYNRISDGAIRTQKDGRRTYITRAELERYVASRD
jgi:excisionase family DNA binding protein